MLLIYDQFDTACCISKNFVLQSDFLIQLKILCVQNQRHGLIPRKNILGCEIY